MIRIAQIFLNILNNATKYSNPCRKISLVVSTEANEAIISIKDTGLGIPLEMLSKIFEMFGQLETPGEETCGGLGIRLSDFKELVEMDAGTIEAKSERAGKGSEFIVKLPLANETSKQLVKSRDTRKS